MLNLVVHFGCWVHSVLDVYLLSLISDNWVLFLYVCVVRGNTLPLGHISIPSSFLMLLVVVVILSLKSPFILN